MGKKMTLLKPVELDHWHPKHTYDEQKEIVTALENGSILYFPRLSFSITNEEKQLFSPDLVSKGRKNISYDPKTKLTKGCEGSPEVQLAMHALMQRFHKCVKAFVQELIPSYEAHLEAARTSFRPVEVQGRDNESFRKDDTLLHVDSFPSTPTGGKRILRFFANVNTEQKPRVWKVGEPYEKVLRRFLPKIKKPFPGSRTLLNRFGLTKSYRILYDHYMLNIHNFMKADQRYQKEVEHEIVSFPPFTCWMVFTDQVSHAALSGQYVFEQSFYLPIESQKNPEKSPLHHMEALFKQRLRH